MVVRSSLTAPGGIGFFGVTGLLGGEGTRGTLGPATGLGGRGVTAGGRGVTAGGARGGRLGGTLSLPNLI